MLSELPEKDRILFVLHYGEGYTAKEIAGILDMNENTVASRLSRGRKKLSCSFSWLHSSTCNEQNGI